MHMSLNREAHGTIRPWTIVAFSIAVLLLLAMTIYKVYVDNTIVHIGQVWDTDPKVTGYVLDVLDANSIEVDYGCTSVCGVRVRRKDADRAVQLLTADGKRNGYEFTRNDRFTP
jgi:hypothetical protein